MPIEIRELVIKATVHKQLQTGDAAYATQEDLRRLKRQIMEAVKSELKEERQDSNGRF